VPAGLSAERMARAQARWTCGSRSGRPFRTHARLRRAAGRRVTNRSAGSERTVGGFFVVGDAL